MGHGAGNTDGIKSTCIRRNPACHRDRYMQLNYKSNLIALWWWSKWQQQHPHNHAKDKKTGPCCGAGHRLSRADRLPLRAGMNVWVRAGRPGMKAASRPGRTILTKD